MLGDSDTCGLEPILWEVLGSPYSGKYCSKETILSAACQLPIIMRCTTVRSPMSLARLEASVSGGAETGPAVRRSAASRAGQIVTPLHSTLYLHALLFLVWLL